MIKDLFAPEHVSAGLLVSQVHYLPAGDHILAQITGESVPDLEVANWSGVVWRTWKVCLRHQLWTTVQRFKDRTPVRLAVAAVPLCQAPPQCVAVDANLTRSTDRHLPGLVVANDGVRVEGWVTEIVI